MEQEESRESFYARVKSMGAKSAVPIDKRSVSRYDLSDCELARPQLFSLSEKSYFTLDRKSIQFNKNCVKHMSVGGAHVQQQVEFCYNPVERVLAVTPVENESAATLHWYSETKGGRVTMRKCGCRGLAQSIFENMSWNEDFKYRVLGNRIEVDGKSVLVFYLDEPIIVVPAKKKVQEEDSSRIISKEVLPEDSEEIPADESTDGEGIDKAQSRSRAIYFDDFAAKEDNIIHLSDLGEDLYNPECIQRLIRKGTVPVEGWGYLNGMARLNPYGFTIYPEEWRNNFGPSIYERQSVKMEYRSDSIAHSSTEDYGWTVGLDLPTMETVRSAIETLRAEIPG